MLLEKQTALLQFKDSEEYIIDNEDIETRINVYYDIFEDGIDAVIEIDMVKFYDGKFHALEWLIIPMGLAGQLLLSEYIADYFTN